MEFIQSEIENYAINHSNTPSQVAKDLEIYTKDNIDMSQMLVGPLEASVLAFLIKSINAKRVLEFGTYTGYSALCMAEALPENGEVVTIDINPKTTALAKEYWEKAKVLNKIKAYNGEALQVLNELKNSQFDFVFIDADKKNYQNYLESSLELLSDSGMIVIDNVLWSGKVLKDNQDESTEAIKEVNSYIKNHKNLFATLLPIRDGMFLIKKIS